MGWQPRDPMALDTFGDWRPFLLAAREARLQELHWALDPLDFRLLGHVVRAKRSRLWTYAHLRVGGELNVDDEGVPHQVRVDRAGRIRTRPISLSAALWGTGVVAEERARGPVHRATHSGWEDCEACQRWEDEQEARLQQGWRRGRSRPVDHEAAEADEAVTPSVGRGARHLRLVR